MKIFCAALVLILGCSREPRTATNTIAPAEPRPAPADTSTISSSTALATAGSPPPASAAGPGTTFVTIESGRIAVQPLLPRGHAVFHIQNRTGTAHELVFRGGSGSTTVTVPPSGRSVAQLLLGSGAFELVCTTAGHDERARFETYAPGVPLPSAAGHRR